MNTDKQNTKALVFLCYPRLSVFIRGQSLFMPLSLLVSQSPQRVDTRSAGGGDVAGQQGDSRQHRHGGADRDRVVRLDSVQQARHQFRGQPGRRQADGEAGPMIATTSFITIRTTLPGCAPRATRMPISRVRCCRV